MSSCSVLHATCLYTDIGTCLQITMPLSMVLDTVICDMFVSLTAGLGKRTLIVSNAIESGSSKVSTQAGSSKVSTQAVRRHIMLKAETEAVSAVARV